MEENKLKEFWDEVHTDIEISRVDIKEVIHKKHCNVISRMLRRQKTLIVLFAIFLIVSIAAGSAFLLFLLLSSIGHYQLLIRSADLCSIKESGAVLKKRLEQRINIDFIIYLIFFYGTALRFISMYFNHSDELKEVSFILILFVGILLVIPWLMRYQQKHRYRYYFNSLDKSRKQLEVSE